MQQLIAELDRRTLQSGRTVKMKKKYSTLIAKTHALLYIVLILGTIYATAFSRDFM